MTPREATPTERNDAVAKSTKVRVTMEPGVVRKVDDRELVDLDRQGLIHSSESGEYGSHEWKPEETDANVVEASAPVTETKTGRAGKKGE